MTETNKDQPSRVEDQGADANPTADNDHPVGYRHPPLQSRFQKGRSGNPKGRPKGSWSGKDLLERALAIPLTVTENGVRRKLPQKDILFRSLLAKAIKGDTKSLTLVLKLIDKWKIDEGRSNVTRIELVIVEPDGTYYHLDQGRKASIHQHKPGSQDLGLYQDGGMLDE
ncbi:MAG: DUF5681 domain-containing protein [Aestuariivirga sp.]